MKGKEIKMENRKITINGIEFDYTCITEHMLVDYLKKEMEKISNDTTNLFTQELYYYSIIPDYEYYEYKEEIYHYEKICLTYDDMNKYLEKEYNISKCRSEFYEPDVYYNSNENDKRGFIIYHTTIERLIINSLEKVCRIIKEVIYKSREVEQQTIIDNSKEIINCEIEKRLNKIQEIINKELKG